MTALIDLMRLRQIAADTRLSERWVPVLHWTIDEATKRPIGTWRLDLARTSPKSSSNTDVRQCHQ